MKPIVLLVLTLSLFSVTPGQAQPAAQVPPAVTLPASADLPLDSSIYVYLEKLDGLGLLPEVSPGKKPYSRMQVAAWTAQMQRKLNPGMPEYAKNLLRYLQVEFQDELNQLNGIPASAFKLKQITFGAASYQSRSIPQTATKSYYHPFNTNNYGRNLDDGWNGFAGFQFEGSVSENLSYSIQPYFQAGQDTQNADLTEAYISAKIGALSFQAGKQASWWGQGTRGTLTLSNNAEPFNNLSLSTMQPVKLGGMFSFLGNIKPSLLYGQMEKNRSDVRRPGFMGIRTDFAPNENLTFGISRTSILGGEGHGLSGSDFWNFLIGKNADKRSQEKWDSIAGFDLRIRFPKANGLQLYGELYGEDQFNGIPPGPSRLGHIAGIYIPRLTPSGDWDLLLEQAKTSDWWYKHWVYTDGYTYKQRLIGDAMGNDANRYYLRLGHFTSNGSRISFNYEHLLLEPASARPTIDSYWLDLIKPLGHQIDLSAKAGYANIGNNKTDTTLKSDVFFEIAMIYHY